MVYCQSITKPQATSILIESFHPKKKTTLKLELGASEHISQDHNHYLQAIFTPN